MITLFVKWIFGVFTKVGWLRILAAMGITLAVIAIWTSSSFYIDKVKAFFGFDTVATLRDKVAQVEIGRDIAVEANKGLVVALDSSDKTIKNTNAAVTSQSKVRKETKAQLDAARTKRDENIATIKKNTESAIEGRKLISKYQIDYVWDLFCKYNVAEECIDMNKVKESQ